MKADFDFHTSIRSNWSLAFCQSWYIFVQLHFHEIFWPQQNNENEKKYLWNFWKNNVFFFLEITSTHCTLARNGKRKAVVVFSHISIVSFQYWQINARRFLPYHTGKFCQIMAHFKCFRLNMFVVGLMSLVCRKKILHRNEDLATDPYHV